MSDVFVVATVVALASGLGWWFLGPKRAFAASLADGVQTVRVTVRGGYSPSRIRAEAGVPLRLIFDRQESGDCTSKVVFAEFGVSAELPAFAQTTVDLPSGSPGEYGFTCGLNMVHGVLVVEARATTGLEAEQKSSETASMAPRGDTTVEEALNRTKSIPPDGVPSDGHALVIVPPVVRDGSAQPTTEGSDEDPEVAEGRSEIADLTRRVGVGAVLTAPVLFGFMVNDFFHAAWLPSLFTNPWFALAFIAPVFLYTGWPIHRTGWMAFAHRSPDMNSLITLGTCAAFLWLFCLIRGSITQLGDRVAAGSSHHGRAGTGR